MKLRIIFLILPVVLSVNAIAQNMHKTINGPQFETLTISGPVTVELVESETASVYALGSYDFVNGINTYWSKKDLQVTYSGYKGPESNIIRINVTRVKKIYLEEGANAISRTPLRSAYLVLTVNDQCRASILNYGKVRVLGEGGIDMKYMK